MWMAISKEMAHTSQGTTEAPQTQATGTTTPPRETETPTRVRREAEQGTIPLAQTTTVLVGRSSKALGAASTTTTSQVVRSMYRSVKHAVLFWSLALVAVSANSQGTIYYKRLIPDAMPLEMASARCELSGNKIYKDTYNDYVDRFTPKRMDESTAALALLTIPFAASREAQDAYDFFYERCMRANGWVRDN